MKEAPARISMIMQVTRVAPITLCQNDVQLSMPWYQAMTSEPMTPQAAHSVAVAQPHNSAANTSRISSSVGMSCADSRSFSRSDIFGSGGGVFSGCSNDHTMM